MFRMVRRYVGSVTMGVLVFPPVAVAAVVTLGDVIVILFSSCSFNGVDKAGED